jgi:hypothetical protein
MLCPIEAFGLMRPVNRVEATGTFMRHLTSGRRDPLQDEFALLQSDFTGDGFYCSGSFADDPSSRPSNVLILR